MPTPNPSYFPPLTIPSMGGSVSPQTTIMVWADATKAFACKKSEIPEHEKHKMREADGYPALHIGERNLELMGDSLGVWAQIFNSNGIQQLATIDCHNWKDPLQMKELAVYGEHANEGSFESEVIGEIAPYVDFEIAKTTFDSFFETDLKDQLEALHEGLHPLQVCLVIGGFVTHIVVASLAFRAVAMGYQVVVPSFLVGDFKRIHHQNFLRNVFPAWGVIVVNNDRELCELLGIPLDSADRIRALKV